MGTRSRFGIENQDGTITSVYHHWDGYPDWLGKKLKENYNTEEKIRKVMEKGDISTIESSADWNRNTLEEKIVLYYADRGEDTPPTISKNFNDFYNLTIDCGGEFAYLFKNNTWHCFASRSQVTEIPTILA